jgi:hypothetical protein
MRITIRLKAHLYRLMFFDQRGPPAWYLGNSQNSSDSSRDY